MKVMSGVRELHGAFGGAYRRYRIDGVERKGHVLDVETFFNRTRNYIKNLIIKEIKGRAARTQAITWIRFTRDDVETVDLAFNSRMTTVYNLNDKNEIVTAMIEHMAQQIENPALRNSKFVFDRILHMDIDFHRLNLTRGSSYIPLPDWLLKKKAIINPRNSDMECFKWAIIAAMKWEEVGNNPERVSKLKIYEEEFDWSGSEFPVRINVHTPSGWYMYSKIAYGSGVDGFSQHGGRDCVSKFCKHIISEAKRLYNSTPRKPMDPLTNEETLEFKRARECHICFKEFSLKDRKVRDHCHYTGKYRGAAHVSCNLGFKSRITFQLYFTT